MGNDISGQNGVDFVQTFLFAIKYFLLTANGKVDELMQLHPVNQNP